MNKKFFIFLFAFILLFSFVSAVPPVQSTTIAERGLEIEATNFEYLTQNDFHVFRFRVYNSSNNVYINPDNVTCSFGLIDNMGEFVYNFPDVSSTGFIFMANVSGGNFSRLGYYHTGINCLLDDGTAGAVLTQSLEVTNTGIEETTPSLNASFYLLLFFVGLTMVLFLVTKKTNFDQWYNKVKKKYEDKNYVKLIPEEKVKSPVVP